MKRIYMILCGLLIGIATLLAQPSTVQKAAKSVFSLTTFDKDGKIVGTSQGVFIDNKGTAISTFTPFIGAVKAMVVDATGASLPVDAIMGADELYNVAKFRVKGTTKGADLAGSTNTGERLWLVPYSIQKPSYQEDAVTNVEKFHNTYNYYIFTTAVPENAVGCPYLNRMGQVVGIMHANNGADVTAIDANYIKQLKVTGLSTLDAALRETSIRTALPENEQDAITMMTLNKGQKTAEEYAQYADEFIELFPTSAFGYKEKASYLVNLQRFEEAAKLMEQGIKKIAAKDEAHSNYADVIYQKITFQGDSTFTAWTLDKAINEAQAAYTVKPEPIYKHQEAQITYLKGDYEKALNLFMDLTKTKINSGELYYEAAQSKAQLHAPDSEIQELLDSAISVGQRTGIVAPYYLARAQYLDAKGEYRLALKDYNEYDSIARPTDHPFFYARYKCELQVRQWQQALLDIARACYLNPQEPTYFAEWASLDLRVKRYDEGISAATQCTKLAPEYPDGYLLLGLLQIEKGLKDEGVQNLEKAKELGDSRAENYIKKYK